MTERVRQHLIAYNTEKGYPTTEGSLIETLTEAKVLHQDEYGSRRWWDDVVRVVEINGMFIEFGWAETTGDNSARDMGWEFDPSSITEVVKKERVVTQIYFEAVK